MKHLADAVETLLLMRVAQYLLPLSVLARQFSFEKTESGLAIFLECLLSQMLRNLDKPRHRQFLDSRR